MAWNPARQGSPQSAPAGDPSWRLPVGLMLGAFIVLLDVSIVTVALPDIGTSLRSGTAGMQWVADAYILVLSALLLSSGTLGDRYGRKRAYLLGVAVFTLASLGCAAAPGIGVLIAGRAVQGAAAALVFTGTLSNPVQAYPEPGRRARMMGLSSTIGGLAIITGPLLGGVLVDTVGWRGIFLINLPVGLLTLWLGARSIPETADPEHASFDPAGQILGLVSLGTLTYGLIETQNHGWSSPATLAPLAVAATAGCAFVLVERRARNPMLPVALFRQPRFTIANIASFVLGFGTSAVFLLLSLYLQQVQGHSAMSTGLRFIPLTVSICAVAPFAARLAGRHGPFPVMVFGYLVSGVALAGLVLLRVDTDTATLAGLCVVLGVGMGASIAPTQIAGVAALPVQRSGLAAACISTSRQVGTALGVAILGLVVATHAGTDVGTTQYAEGFVRGLHVAAIVTGAATVVAATMVAGLARSQSRLSAMTPHQRRHGEQHRSGQARRPQRQQASQRQLDQDRQAERHRDRSQQRSTQQLVDPGPRGSGEMAPHVAPASPSAP